MQFLLKAKGYILHYLIIGIAFLDPSVQAYFAAHTLYAMVGLALWGSILHWANGKLTVPPAKLVMLALCLLCVGTMVGCNAQQAAQTTSNVINGILNIAQAEEAALSPTDSAIMTPWVNLGFTLDSQLNTCINAAGGTKAKLASCITGFTSGLLSPAELAQLRILSPAVQTKVQIVATAVIIAVNGALTQFGAAAQPNPTVAAVPATHAELHELSARLEAEGYAVR